MSSDLQNEKFTLLAGQAQAMSSSQFHNTLLGSNKPPNTLSTIADLAPSSHDAKCSTNALPIGEQQFFRFLDLPTELRLEIYRHTLVHPKLPVYLPDRLPEPSMITRTRRWNTRPLYLHTLYLCRQIHAEAKPIFYGENRFVLAVNNDEAGLTIDARGAAFDTIPLNFIRSLAVRIRLYFLQASLFQRGGVNSLHPWHRWVAQRELGNKKFIFFAKMTALRRLDIFFARSSDELDRRRTKWLTIHTPTSVSLRFQVNLPIGRPTNKYTAQLLAQQTSLDSIAAESKPLQGSALTGKY